MIYLGYNRDLDSVAHFWRNRLHEGVSKLSYS